MFKEKSNKNELIKKNKEIRARQVRLISENGEQLGIKSLNEALSDAQYAGLDLVEISPQASPPVCKIMDYSKYIYNKSKREKVNKQKKRVTKVLSFKYKIDNHDLEIKIEQARKFLEKGSDVRVEMRFKGREVIHTGRMIEKMKEVSKMLSENGNVTVPSVEQKSVVLLVSPKQIK